MKGALIVVQRWLCMSRRGVSDVACMRACMHQCKHARINGYTIIFVRVSISAYMHWINCQASFGNESYFCSGRFQKKSDYLSSVRSVATPCMNKVVYL